MRTMLKGKIHRAFVTGADINYQGSITIDADLLEAADMIENEQVHVFNIENGARLVTYIIKGEPGKGEITLNGAAARSAEIGDKVIIVTYTTMSEEDATKHVPSHVWPDANNKILRRSP